MSLVRPTQMFQSLRATWKTAYRAQGGSAGSDAANSARVEAAESSDSAPVKRIVFVSRPSQMRRAAVTTSATSTSFARLRGVTTEGAVSSSRLSLVGDLEEGGSRLEARGFVVAPSSNGTARGGVQLEAAHSLFDPADVSEDLGVREGSMVENRNDACRARV